MVEAAIDGGSNVGDTRNRDIKVFFDANANNDTHNRSLGNTDANWFRHWGLDEDNAVSNISATGSVTLFGKDVSFIYGGTGNGANYAEYNGSTTSPVITVFDFGNESQTENFSSAAMMYTNSVGVNVNAPIGAISISFSKSGIDLMQMAVQHEAEHLNTDLKWLPPNGVWFMTYGTRTVDDGDLILESGENDFDDDEIPNIEEDSLIGFRWDRKTTHPGFYLSNDDEEAWIENIVKGVAAGVAAKDWALAGKQPNPNN